MTGATASGALAADGPLIVACAALTSDLRAVLGQTGLSNTTEVRYVKASLHNRPDLIADAVVEQIAECRIDGRMVVVGFADCGTGGGIDAVVDSLQERGATATRLPGAHCYEFFAGERFADLHDRSPGTFYLTDFLARHFDALVWSGLGLDRHPELALTYFGNYTHLVLLSQTDDPDVVLRARAAAERLGLQFDQVHVGRDRLVDAVSVTVRAKVA